MPELVLPRDTLSHLRSPSIVVIIVFVASTTPATKLPSHPKLMIARIVPLSAQSKLACNVNISILVPGQALRVDIAEFAIKIIVRGPGCATVWTRRLLCSHGDPRLHTTFVHVVATARFAVYNVVLLAVELVVTNRTLALDWFAVAILFTMRIRGICFDARNGWCVLEHFSQLRGRECKLICNFLASLEYAQHDVDDVLALIALVRMRAIATWNQSDALGVYIASRACHDNLLFWHIVGAAAFAGKDSEALGQSS